MQLTRVNFAIGRIAVAVALAGSFSCATDRRPSRPCSEGDRYVLGIDRNGSLTLDGERLSGRELARELPRLAERVRVKAQAAGSNLEPKNGLPAIIVIWADDETAFSTLYQQVLKCQESGFRRHQFAQKSVYPNPTEIRQDSSIIPPKGQNDLPDEIRTLPIRLHADERGKINQVGLGEQELPDFEALQSAIISFQSDPDTPFDKARLPVDSRLAFSELVRVTRLLSVFNVRIIELELWNSADLRR